MQKQIVLHNFLQWIVMRIFGAGFGQVIAKALSRHTSQVPAIANANLQMLTAKPSISSSFICVCNFQILIFCADKMRQYILHVG